MKRLILMVFFALSASPAMAQSQDPGGIGSWISQTAQSARAGTAVDLNKNVSGILYVPYPAFISADKTTEYGLLGFGAILNRGVSGTALHGAPLILPAIHPFVIVNKLLGKSQHLMFPLLGDLTLGAGLLPLPEAGTNGKWLIKNQTIAAVSVKFGP